MVRLHLALPPLLLLSAATTRTACAAHSRRRRGEVSQRGGRDLQYDRSVTTLDPTGRLLQVEYAQRAAGRGGTVAAAVIGNSAYVFVVTMAEPSSASSSSSSQQQKVHRLDDRRRLWLVAAGLAGDARALARGLRRAVQQSAAARGVDLTVPQAAEWVARAQHELTASGGRRPLGLTALVLGLDGSGPVVLPRLFRCNSGGGKEDCLFAAAGREQEAVENAIANEYERLLQLQQQSEGSSLSPSEVVQRLVEAIQKGLGHDSRRRTGEDVPKLDVWVFRRSEGGSEEVGATCFTGVGDSESFTRVKAFFDSDPESEQQSTSLT